METTPQATALGEKKYPYNNEMKAFEEQLKKFVIDPEWVKWRQDNEEKHDFMMAALYTEALEKVSEQALYAYVAKQITSDSEWLEWGKSNPETRDKMLKALLSQLLINKLYS